MSRYSFDPQFGDVIRRAGIDLGQLLRQCGLPEGLFGRRDILLTRTEYFRLVEALGSMERDMPQLAERIALDGRIETLSPPVFAAYCSDNGMTFLRRLAHYKQLVGPVKIRIGQDSDGVRVTVTSDNDREPLPAFFAKLELMFIVGVLRRATQVHVRPVRSTPASVMLSRGDLVLPFVSRNDAMWQYFEPELRRRLSEMEDEDTVVARVRSALVEMLPAGRATADGVAARLRMGKRTLQRKLAEENTTFQQQLRLTRLLLTKNYLRNGNRSNDDIAFLLGYEDTSSFLRAFSAWTGQHIAEYRKDQATGLPSAPLDDGENPSRKH
ncbi:MAG: helix-turn-helix domain-containing protein [Bacteroidaceae bacterium]|nr:helix-turn-helix domain-containing protein [Bacteroidaceae bacterium]